MQYDLEDRTKVFSKKVKEETEELRLLWKEAHELTLIFNKIGSSLKN